MHSGVGAGLGQRLEGPTEQLCYDQFSNWSNGAKWWLLGKSGYTLLEEVQVLVTWGCPIRDVWVARV